MLRARRQRMVVAQVWLTYRRPELSDVTPYRELIAMNRVIAHTGAKYPIVQAPMGWIARTQLASAVSRAGGLGIIETSSGETEACQVEINKMKALNLPFGVNLPIRFLRDDAMLKFVCSSGVKFVTTSAGSPAKFIAPLKEAGIVVYHAVPTVEAAMKCVDAGIDGLVVEGAEGGGFKNPEEVSTLVLLQGIRARTDVPMIAAGGICDGRGMAAAFALGAEGIQMGTRFVSCAESPVHANYKNAIVGARETSTLVLNKKSTPCIRALKSDRQGNPRRRPDGAGRPERHPRSLFPRRHGGSACAGRPVRGADRRDQAGAANHRGNRGAVLRHHRPAWLACFRRHFRVTPR
jgi:enoyl-[acyl-carrier protein] reductase II